VLITAFSLVFFCCCIFIINKYRCLTKDEKINVLDISLLLIAAFLFYIWIFPIVLDVPNPITEHLLVIKPGEQNNRQINGSTIEIIELKIDNSRISLDSLVNKESQKINEKGYLEISGSDELSMTFSAKQNSTFNILFYANEKSGKVQCTLDNQVKSEIDLFQNEPTDRILNLHSPIPLGFQVLSIVIYSLSIVFICFILFLIALVINHLKIVNIYQYAQIGKIKNKNIVTWLETIFSLLGTLTAIYLLLVLGQIQIKAALSYEYFTPATNIEEASYTYTAANNYIKYGLMNSMLLQDHSFSLYPEGHPFVYTHMPAGPDLLFAFILYVFNGDYKTVRIAVVVLSLIGMCFFYIFINLILKGIGIKTNLAGYAIAMVGPWTIIRLFESQIYPLFPILAFFPLFAWEKYRTTNRKVWLYLFAFISFLSALYIEYSLLSAVLFCYISLFLTKIIRFTKRDIVIYICSVLSGIGLHLIQNFAFYGPTYFFQELVYVLGNRIIGYPSQEQLFEFYQKLGVVHHGAHTLNFRLLLTQINGSLHFINIGENANVNKIFVILIITILTEYLARVLKEPARKLLKVEITPLPENTLQIVKITLWMGVTLLIPVLLFPAFAQEVNIATFGGNFFFAIFEISIIALFFKQVYSALNYAGLSIREKGTENDAQYKNGIQKEWVGKYSKIKKEISDVITKKSRISSSLSIKILYLFLIGLNMVFVYQLIVEQYNYTIRKTGYVDQLLSKNDTKLNLDVSLKEISKFNGQLFMTNINIPTVGFLVQYPGYGVCDPDSISDIGDLIISKCGTDFIKSTDSITLSQKPKYFFFFTYPTLFPGFASCMPSSTMIGARGGNECMNLLFKRLSDNYELKFTNKIVSVFDLQEKIEKNE
jgi:hypothetical protein